MVHLIEQILLAEDVPLFAKLHDLFLVDLFNGDSSPCGLLGGQHHTAVGALAKHFAEFVLIERAALT